MPKTKIIATIGPACDSEKTIEQLILAGVSVFRFNFKHNNLAWHRERLQRVKRIAQKLGLPVGLMVDLKGPELRLGKIKKSGLKLTEGQRLTMGAKGQIVFNYPMVLQELGKGQRILIDDGRLELEVVETGKNLVKVKVIREGLLLSNKGVNLPGYELNLPTLGPVDLEALKLVKECQVDFIALSFVREREDLLNLKRALEREKISGLTVAKIENRAAIENLEEILKETDAVMVARGDLGVELPMEEIPFWQKYIIKRCLRLGKPVITATEMLSSMINNSRPTRADVSDIGNSVYDRSDALMLSAETAIGQFPLEAVGVMSKTCEFIESKLTPLGRDLPAHDQLEAVVLTGFNLANNSDLPQAFAAFVVLTENGKTGRILSSLRPNLPILAITPKREVPCQLCLSFGVESFYFNYQKNGISQAVRETIEFLQAKGKLKKGDKVVMIYGDDWRFPGRTNLVRIQEV